MLPQRSRSQRMELPNPFRRRLSRRLVRAARDQSRRTDMSIQELIETLGDRSFGWCIVIFALVNLIPMPIGGNMITSLPLILLTGQMAAGLRQVRLPGFLTRREISRKGFQKLVLRLSPVIRPVERMVRPRYEHMFTPRQEQLLGLLMFFVAVALFMPIPLSGYIPAISLFLVGFGLVERDGLVVLAGAIIGVVAIAVTLLVGGMIIVGVEALAH